MRSYSFSEIKNHLENNRIIQGEYDDTGIIFAMNDFKNPYMGLAVHSGTCMDQQIIDICKLSHPDRRSSGSRTA